MKYPLKPDVLDNRLPVYAGPAALALEGDAKHEIFAQSACNRIDSRTLGVQIHEYMTGNGEAGRGFHPGGLGTCYPRPQDEPIGHCLGVAEVRPLRLAGRLPSLPEVAGVVGCLESNGINGMACSPLVMAGATDWPPPEAPCVLTPGA